MSKIFNRNRINGRRGNSNLPDEEPSQTHNDDDLGFSKKLTITTDRFLNKDGTLNIVRHGIHPWRDLHLYQWLVLMSWRKLIMIIFLFYTVVNIIFGLIYVSIGVDQLEGIRPGSWWSHFEQTFFFSAQTMSTVGYGGIHPHGFAADAVSGIEALFGLMIFAIITGILFARFSKPSAKIVFSKNALISPYEGDKKAFIFRLVNGRRNLMVEVEAQIIATWIEITPKSRQRRYATLELERDKAAMLPLNWNVVHVIDEDSPLADWTAQDYEDNEVEFLISLKGFDDTFGQTVRAYSSYTYKEIIWDAKFDLMFHTDETGHIVLDLDKINEVIKL